ncbi:MAG TPA: BrnT family toxin [Candidatus Nanopelagicaceae bacterium]|jgi:hypothetical protein
MRFEWDNDKNDENQHKHQLSFELASEVFSDPFHILNDDLEFEGEERYWAIGCLQNQVVVIVVHTYRVELEDGLEEIIRIISARKATPRERAFYEEETK